jgi:catalase
VTGKVGRYDYVHPNDDYEQPRALYRNVMSETDRHHLTENIAGSLKNCRRDVQERMLKLFVKIDADYGGRIAKLIGIPAELAKL